MSRGEHVRGRGSMSAISGKLRMAEWPLMVRAATSWARAAISGVAKVPSQMRDFLRGSRISDTHFPQLRFRTPWYTGCLLLCFWAFEVVELECEPEDEEEVVSEEFVSLEVVVVCVCVCVFVCVIVTPSGECLHIGQVSNVFGDKGEWPMQEHRLCPPPFLLNYITLSYSDP
uniref:Uncharacterized protein n=1 Tax=Cajanus cajan TaxID=3821 RepID=A0A151SH45_CAJCA|nr:hypothetical protein KK1_000338 [Cajanus cajan]